MELGATLCGAAGVEVVIPPIPEEAPPAPPKAPAPIATPKSDGHSHSHTGGSDDMDDGEMDTMNTMVAIPTGMTTDADATGNSTWSNMITTASSSSSMPSTSSATLQRVSTTSSSDSGAPTGFSGVAGIAAMALMGAVGVVAL